MKRLICLFAALFATVAFAADTAAVEAKIKQLELEWAQAAAKGDSAFYDRYEADDYTVTDPTGTVGSKSKDISEIKNHEFTAQAMEVDDLKVKVIGNVAIATGRMNIKGGKYKGQDISGLYRFTDIWANRGGKWQAVHSAETAIAKK